MKYFQPRHCERSEAIHSNKWIATSRYALLAMTAMFIALAAPAFAQSNYNTPVYSGPSANIDSGGMGGTEPMVTRRAPIGPSSSDRGFDRHVEDRGAKISREMDRRRDESIERNEKHILKTNE